jgi:HEAT repeat protein
VEPSELVQLFAARSRELEAMTALVGSVNTRELRSVEVDDTTIDALIDGLTDPQPRIRWWCVQLLDHIPAPRAIEAIARALDDPVPRVRRNAAHALSCTSCKPQWDGALADTTRARLHEMAERDPNAKVRAEARYALG